MISWIHSDHLHSATILTDDSGTEIRRLAYRAFGEELENQGQGDKPKYSYTGKERDASGLMYYGARYYDPALSRFITPDTIYDRGPQGLNRYSYALNNPIRYNDPSGHFINGPDDEQNPTGDGCVTGSPENGGEEMVYHENFDDPSHLDVGYEPRWPHRIASMSDDIIIPAARRGDELWEEPGSAIEQAVKKAGRKAVRTAGDYAGTLLGRDDNPLTGEPIAASSKQAVIMDVIATAAFYAVSKIGSGGALVDDVIEALPHARLSKGRILNYLDDAENVPRGQLTGDLQSLGLRIKGQSPDGRFMEFIDKQANLRAKIHPPDVKTQYHHLHLYDSQGNSLNKLLQKVSFRDKQAHIKIRER